MTTTIRTNITVITLIFIILFIVRPYYISNESDLVIAFETIDEGITYQVFYTGKNDDNFSEIKSIKYSTTKSSSFTKNEIHIGNIEYLQSIRLDVGFGNDTIKLKNLKITDGKNERHINNKLLLKTKNNFFESIKINNDYLLMNTKSEDPFFEIGRVDFTPEKILKINYIMLFNITFLSYLVLIALISWLNSQSSSFVASIKKIYVIFFIFIILIPPIFIDNNEMDLVENRMLNKPPTFEDIKNFDTGKFESWYKDHFGFRNNYINLKNILYNQKIITIPFVNKDIINKRESGIAFSGKDNWLWLINDNSILNYTNIERYNNEELNRIQYNIEGAQEFFSNKNIELYFFISPDKNQIYPEFYPNYINRKSNYSKTDQLFDYLKKSKNNINIIYPKEELLKYKNNHDDLLYWKTDTHWNTYGAYVGYTKLANSIKDNYLDIDILENDELSLKYEKYPLGDLSNNFSDSSKIYNEFYRVYNKQDNYTFQYIENEQKDMIITKNNNKNIDVLMFRDSFASSMIPYISETFNNCIYIWDFNIRNNISKVEYYKPDIVIIEIVERNTKSIDSFDKFNLRGIR